MNKKYFPLIIIFLIIVLIDQITKFYIASNFELYQSIEIIRGFFNITYIRNSGVAFGMFSNLKGSFIQIIFIAIYIIAIISILILYRETHGYSHIALSLIFSGAIGNLIDRIFRGEVVSNRAQKTAIVKWHYYNYVPKYERYERRNTKVAAYNPECLSASIGDTVTIAECRPLSKTKQPAECHLPKQAYSNETSSEDR